MKSLEAALTAFDGVTIDQIRKKSVSLTGLFIEVVREILVPLGFSIESPEDPDHRGSHVALGFQQGKTLVDALAEKGIIADFRPPNLMRFGFSALYNTHSDVAKLATILAEHASGR
jgi:kynureninase